ncbi:MAG TPA: hypothetical protein VN894_05920 [Polyangiaceae bacterium]|nr:hypothetical protein [Polyangiaceae bacterium]
MTGLRAIVRARAIAHVLRAAALGAAPLAACTLHEPPTPEGTPSRARPELVPTPPTATPLIAPPTSSISAPSPAPGTDPALLPQTREMPRASGIAFDARVVALWDAIVNDDPERAMVFFFPLRAYEQVKDVGAPAADWTNRLVAAYVRDIHALHGHLGNDATGARLVALEVPEARARWVEPGEEYNKIGYFRVFGSKLRYEVDAGAGAFDVKSLISWRGQWYVVHLSAIK